jgi:hypothetical protein
MDSFYLNVWQLGSFIEWSDKVQRLSGGRQPSPQFKAFLTQIGSTVVRLDSFKRAGDLAGAGEFLVAQCTYLNSRVQEVPGFSKAGLEKQVKKAMQKHFGAIAPEKHDALLGTLVKVGEWTIPFSETTVALDDDSDLQMGSLGVERPERYLDVLDAEARSTRAGGERSFGELAAEVWSTRAGAAATGSAGEGKKTFFFNLAGEAAQGRAIVAGTKAELSFEYALPPDKVLATVDSALLEKARSGDADISLVLTPGDGVSVLSARQATARFSKGSMTNRVAFQIAVAEDAPRDASVHVDFSVAGDCVHQMKLVLEVVASKDALRDASATGDRPADLAGVLAEAVHVGNAALEQRIVMTLAFLGGRFSIDLQDWRGSALEFTDSFVSRDLDRARLAGLVPRLKAVLERIYTSEIWLAYQGSEKGDADVDLALEQAVAEVAAAGWLLKSSLCADAEIARAIEYVESNAAPGATVTVSTDDVFLPWECLYPEFRALNMTELQKARSPLSPAKFWGARFAFETIQRGNGSIGQLRRVHAAARPGLSLNLNPSISIDGASPDAQPAAVHRAWAESLRTQNHLTGIQEKCKDIRAVLQDASDKATVIYLYCHGVSPSPFGGEEEKLELVDGCELRPSDLAVGPQYAGAPIIILNSCESGQFSPLTFSSFLSEFRKRGALGLIATSCSVPVAFAARFGNELILKCLERQGSLASSLHGLRRKHLLERGNPVPLFYTLLCQMNFAAAAA